MRVPSRLRPTQACVEPACPSGHRRPLLSGELRKHVASADTVAAGAVARPDVAGSGVVGDHPPASGGGVGVAGVGAVTATEVAVDVGATHPEGDQDHKG